MLSCLVRRCLLLMMLVQSMPCTGSGYHHHESNAQAVRVARPWLPAPVHVGQKSAQILRGGGTKRRDQGSCELDTRRISGAEVAETGVNDGDESTALSEPMVENMSDMSDESLKDADLVFRDQDIQNEWLQFVEQGLSPTVKPRCQNNVKLRGNRCHMDTLLGTGELLGQKGAKTPVNTLASKEVVGLYFSAHWCGPCRGFTPALASSYTSIVAKGKSFEIVFVSSDRDEASFQSYFAEMPWLALPFADRQTKQALSDKFGVQGIPTLVLLHGATGELISMDGRRIVANDGEGSFFPWKDAAPGGDSKGGCVAA